MDYYIFYNLKLIQFESTESQFNRINNFSGNKGKYVTLFYEYDALKTIN